MVLDDIKKSELSWTRILSLTLVIMLITSTVPLGSFSFSQPAEASSSNTDEPIYVGTGGGYVKKILPNGTVDWKHNVSGNLPVEHIYYDSQNGYVYAASQDSASKGGLAKLHAENGTVKWEKSSFRTMSSHGKAIIPVPDTGDILVSSYEEITRLNPDGTIQTTYGTSDGHRSGLALSPNGKYIVYGFGASGTTSDTVRVAYAHNGTTKHSTSYKQASKTVPAYLSDGSAIAFADSYQGDTSDAAEKIFDSDLTNPRSPIPTDSSVISSDDNGNWIWADNGVASYDPSSSSYDWNTSHTTSEEVRVIGDLTYAVGGDNTVNVVDTDTGDLVDQFTGHDFRAVDVVGSVAKNGLATDPSGDITGIVEACAPQDTVCQDGSPVSGAVVEAVVLNDTEIKNHVKDSDQTLEEARQEVISNMYNPVPESWNPNTQVKSGSDSVLANASESKGLVPIINNVDDWNEETYTDGAHADRVEIKVPSNKQFVVTAWDPTDEGIVEDSVDRDLQGKTVDGAIKFRKLAPSGETVRQYTVSLDETYNANVPLGRDHKYAKVALQPGYYQVSVVDSGGEERAGGYVIQVGSKYEISRSYAPDQVDVNGTLTNVSQRVSDYVNNSVITTKRDRSNADGEYAIRGIGDNVVVGLTAYKSGDKLESTSLKNASYGTLVDKIEDDSNYNQTLYVSRGTTKVETPKSNVTLQMTKLSPPKNPEMMDSWLDAIKDIFDSEHYLDLAREYSNLDKTKSELENRSSELQNQTEVNQEIKNKAQDELEENGYSGDIIVKNPDDLTKTELKAVINAIIDAKNSESPDLSSNIGDSPSVDDNLLVDAKLPFDTGLRGDELTLDGVVVTAYHGDGSTETVSDEYLSIKQSMDGTQVVQVKDYPLPSNSSSVRFSASAVTADSYGVASTRTAANPTMSDGVPTVKSIDLSTLRPAVGETVEMSLTGGTRYRSLEDLTVYGPSGTTVSSVVSNGTAKFQPADVGSYTVKYTVSDIDGTNYTDSIRLAAESEDLDSPPSIRIDDSTFGRVGIVGDGAVSGDVEAKSDGSTLARVNLASDENDPVHVYTHDMSGVSKLSVRLQDSSGRSLDERRTVAVHIPTTSSDALYYRNGVPLSADNVNTTGEGAVIHTYTDDNSELDIRVLSDPSTLQVIRYQVDAAIAKIPNPMDAVSLSIMPAQEVIR